ncbi:MAG: hypothetical protein BWY82_02088 [Verrucomicrobia bacterium ADurb.Bin474]|nr:MAG: hypothetical protein BWY82_02088 [Verrucomicrobia bacterium ADurb.Bin474]
MWPEGLIANFVSDVETHPVHPVCSSSLLDRINRTYRIGGEMSHARLTLHAASALPPSLFDLWRTRKTPIPQEDGQNMTRPLCQESCHGNCKKDRCPGGGGFSRRFLQSRGANARHFVFLGLLEVGASKDAPAAIGRAVEGRDESPRSSAMR